jgi:hypothetical protein
MAGDFEEKISHEPNDQKSGKETRRFLILDGFDEC